DNADGCHEAGVLLADEPAPDRARLDALAARACQLSPSACDLDAYLHATGKTGDKDEARATASYVRACQAGNGIACSSAASRIAHGTGVAADGPLAVAIWERGCETGAGDDCYEAGLSYRDGELVPADHARALDLFRRGCLRGSPDACEEGADLSLAAAGGADAALALYRAGCDGGRGETCTRLGDVLRDGEGVKADPAGAAAAYRAGCEARHPDGVACTSLARAYQAGRGVGADPAAALAALTRGCRLGDNGSCFELDGAAAAAHADDATRAATLQAMQDACDDSAERVEDACLAAARILAEGGTLAARDPRRARALADASCQRGYRHACLMLADLDLGGVGAVADRGRASDRYRALCDEDVTEACWKLANLLAEDHHADDAARLYQRACDDGMGAGCNSWGYALFTGQGADWSTADAMAAYRKACELGDAYGCANVGELLELGVGAAPDVDGAAAAYRQACTDDTAAGCARLARLYERGHGTHDRAEVTRLYRRACEEEGAPEACHALARRVREDRGPAGEAARLDVRAVDLARSLSADNPYFAYVLGTFHQDGVALDADHAAAARWYQRACDGREPLGCLAIGEAYLAGDGVPRDRARAA
ncbi:MAG TPA: tetratricopeptide repeat protein, partial [Kofleriaceae bacterium]|nr:tetratricopeptide repeat protein [Kofleriaceae bacterium]